MQILKSGNNKGCSVFWYDIGWDLGDDFNSVRCASYEHAIPEAVKLTAADYGELVEDVCVRKIRTNSGKVIWQKSGAEFLK